MEDSIKEENIDQSPITVPKTSKSGTKATPKKRKQATDGDDTPSKKKSANRVSYLLDLYCR